MAGCKFGCGIGIDADGKPSIMFHAPACDAITTGGGAYSGIACITNPVTGEKEIFVAPDAGGRAQRLAVTGSTTFAGDPMTLPTTLNVGTHTIYNEEQISFINNSCARNQHNIMAIIASAQVRLSANAHIVVVLSDTNDSGATWFVHTEQRIDCPGLAAHDDTIQMVGTIYSDINPGATRTHGMKMEFQVITGSITIDDLAFVWGNIGVGLL